MAKSSYTEEELISFLEHPVYSKKNKFWGMDLNGKTYWIPYNSLKRDHLENIIKWIKQNINRYGNSQLEEMEDLYRVRFCNSIAGKLLYGPK